MKPEIWVFEREVEKGVWLPSPEEGAFADIRDAKDMLGGLGDLEFLPLRLAVYVREVDAKDVGKTL